MTGVQTCALPISYPVEVGKEYTFTTYFDATKLAEDGKVKGYEGFVQFDDTKLQVEAIDEDNTSKYCPVAGDTAIVNVRGGNQVFFNAGGTKGMNFLGEGKVAITLKFTVIAEGTSTIYSFQIGRAHV